MSTWIRRLVIVFIGLLVLYGIRLVTIYTGDPVEASRRGAGAIAAGGDFGRLAPMADRFFPGSLSKQYEARQVANIASESYADSAAAQGATEQKYEKIAELASRTETFDESQKAIREAIVRHQSIVQYESRTGLEGHRHLNLTIGVPPERFDAAVTDLRAVGETTGFAVTKVDKTNEYRTLMARRDALTRTRDNLAKLKERDGGIEEFVKLEEKITELESQLQSLGVQLGQFDTEHEFCTVQMALREIVPRIMEIRHWAILIGAFLWALWVYVAVLVVLAIGAVVLTIGVYVRDRLRSGVVEE